MSLCYYNCEGGSQSLGKMQDEMREVAASAKTWLKRGGESDEENDEAAETWGRCFLFYAWDAQEYSHIGRAFYRVIP